jgi:hypothetical protein
MNKSEHICRVKEDSTNDNYTKELIGLSVKIISTENYDVITFYQGKVISEGKYFERIYNFTDEELEIYD